MRACRSISRRLWVAGATLFLIVPSGAGAQSGGVSSQQSSSQESQDHLLLLYNTHTGERIELVYRHGDQYIPGALARLDYFLRDHRTGGLHHFDLRLYDILSDLTLAIGHSGDELYIVRRYLTPSPTDSHRTHSTAHP